MHLTCISCRVAFSEADVQRDHYRTEWHRYNLKRKVAELPPVTLENFNERLTEQSANKSENKNLNKFCDVCIKTFSSTNSYESHLRSKRHKDFEAGIGKDNRKANARDNVRLHIKAVERKTKKNQDSASISDKSTESESIDEEVVEEVDEEDLNGLGLEQCLFCDNIGETLDDNLNHMTLKHSFFLPDADYITDLEGLINYLGLKVGDGHMCLWCNDKGKMFLSTLAAQRHMVSKGHCKILHEGNTLAEFADFYDYRSSYPDADLNDDDEESEEEGQDVDMISNSETVSSSVNEEDYQLVLPSGSTVGHRSLMKYYKQNLRVTNPKAKNTSRMSHVLAQYKALGWTGTTGKVALRKAKDLQFMERKRMKHRVYMGMKNNKVLTTHYRDQVFCYF